MGSIFCREGAEQRILWLCTGFQAGQDFSSRLRMKKKRIRPKRSGHKINPEVNSVYRIQHNIITDPTSIRRRTSQHTSTFGLILWPSMSERSAIAVANVELG